MFRAFPHFGLDPYKLVGTETMYNVELLSIWTEMATTIFPSVWCILEQGTDQGGNICILPFPVS